MKRNKILSLILVVFVSALILSCADDFLNLEPKTNLLEANSYKTEQDAYAALVAVYDAYSLQNWNFVPLQSDIFSDDAFCAGEPGGGMWQWQAQEMSVIDAEQGASSDLWSRCYSGIYRANMFFEKEAGIAWTSEATRIRYDAEVHALRAWFNWDLVRHFGWVPLVPELLPSSEDYKSNPQRTPEEVYAFVVQDLLTALPNLPITVPYEEKGRLTQDAIKVLLARIYLFYEGFAKPVLGAAAPLSFGGTEINKTWVLNAMEEIISSHRYQLLPDYASVFAWDNEENAESILEYHYSDVSAKGDWNAWSVDGNFAVIFYGPRSPDPSDEYSSGWSFAVPTWSLCDEFEDADSVRYNVSVFDANKDLTGYTKGFQNTGYFNHKYMPRTAFYPTQGGDQALNWPKNYIDMRYAEVLLIAAELLLNDNNGKATDYFNEVRKRAMGAGAAKASITLDDIYHERRVEFSGEGQRKWDLLRRGLDYAKTWIDKSWIVPAGIPNPDEFIGREFKTDTWGMLPIPAAEINLADPGLLKQYVPAFQ
jgi:starch-binding outer membrane protein, SusD/RagB family